MKASWHRSCCGVDMTAGCAQYPHHFPAGDTALSADKTSSHVSKVTEPWTQNQVALVVDTRKFKCVFLF